MNPNFGATLLMLATSVCVLVAAAAPPSSNSHTSVSSPGASGAPAAGASGTGASAPGAGGSATAGTPNASAGAGVTSGDDGPGVLAADACSMGMEDNPETLRSPYAGLATSVCVKRCTGDTLCLRADTGELLCESSPSEIGAGSTLTVRVFGPKGCSDEIELSSATRKRLDTIFESRTAEKEKEQGGAAEELVELKSAQITVSSDVAVVALQVNFERRAKPEPITSTHEVNVLHGYYYLAVAALLPVVPNGKREAVAQPGASDGEPRLIIDPDLYITPALALNAFPFGGKSRGQVFCCRSGRALQEMVGLQVGVGLDFSEPPALFGGILLEPIAGFGLSGGLALLQNDVLNDDAVEGMLLRGSSTLPVHRSYRPHGYLALTLSLDIIDTVVAAKTKLAGTNIQ